MPGDGDTTSILHETGVSAVPRAVFRHGLRFVRLGSERCGERFGDAAG